MTTRPEPSYRRGASEDRQAIVVSFARGNPLWPRVQRTKHLVAALEREFKLQVQRVPGPAADAVSTYEATLPGRVARKALRPLLVDPFEVTARLALRGWDPSGTGALLIAWPFSPIYVAASRLVAAGIPYVVDVGDPWALTEPVPSPWTRFVERRRAEAAETFLWQHAAGGIVTTGRQANSLRALFPDLELLVRPNGYSMAAEPEVNGKPARADASELRLVQFGSVNSLRLPIGDWLSRLRVAAGLTKVRFANYGHVDRPELLRSLDPAVVVETHDPVDWGQACQIARAFDAALVVANRNPAQLPSKAVQYLTLPIPRIALTASRDRGELGAFASQRPAFIVVGEDSPEDVLRLMGHLRREWSDEELRSPAVDSWPQVARQVAGFAIECWDRAAPANGLHIETVPAGALT
jgi:hypothetical protein